MMLKYSNALSEDLYRRIKIWCGQSEYAETSITHFRHEDDKCEKLYGTCVIDLPLKPEEKLARVIIISEDSDANINGCAQAVCYSSDGILKYKTSEDYTFSHKEIEENLNMLKDIAEQIKEDDLETLGSLKIRDSDTNNSLEKSAPKLWELFHYVYRM